MINMSYYCYVAYILHKFFILFLFTYYFKIFSFISLTAFSIPVASLPPAVAKYFCPPPPPLIFFDTSLINFPQSTSFSLTKLSETIIVKDTLLFTLLAPTKRKFLSIPRKRKAISFILSLFNGKQHS